MSLAAEKGVIGCLLLDKKNITAVCQILLPEMFTDSFLSRVYYEIRYGFETNTEIDEVVLSRKLADTIRDEKDVIKDLVALVQGQFNSDKIDTYAAIVIRDYRARKASEIINKVEFDGEDVDRQIRDVSASLQSLLSESRQNEANVAEIAETYKEDYFKEDTRPRVKIGLKEFDDAINLCGGDVMAIGARPKTGKSALAMQIAVHLQEIGLKVAYFNLEMTKKQMFERLTAFTGFLDLNRILNGTRYLEGEKEKFDAALEKMRKMTNLTIFSGSKRVSDIRADANGKGFDVIIIDYLQLIRPDGKRGANRYAEVGDISRGIKSIAMDFNIPVIILSQLNRVSEMKTDKEPSAADFRESGDIEQDVSIAMILWSPEKDNDTKRTLKIELNRQGKRKRSDLYFEGKYMRFYEVDVSGEPIKPQDQRKGGFVQTDETYDIPFD